MYIYMYLYTLNHVRDPCVISGIFLNQGVLGSMGAGTMRQLPCTTRHGILGVASAVDSCRGPQRPHPHKDPHTVYGMEYMAYSSMYEHKDPVFCFAALAVSKGPQSQLRYCWWYRSSHSTDFDISEIASPVLSLFRGTRQEGTNFLQDPSAYVVFQAPDLTSSKSCKASPL